MDGITEKCEKSSVGMEKSMGKVYGGIIGAAVGDALGVPVEFMSREELAKSPVTGMQGYGRHNQPMGTWSDDTSLTLALTDSIVRRQTVDYYDIMDKFSEWLLYGAYTATEEVFDAGGATSRAIMNYGRGMNPLECGGMSEYENGNGSLMRILPAAYYLEKQSGILLSEQMEIVHNISSLTHRHPISLIGCGIYVNVALKLLSDSLPLKEGIRQGMEEAFQYYISEKWEDISVYDRLKDIKSFAALPEAEIRSSGYIVDTLEAAVWCLVNTYSFRECILKAVNLGDDTDTVGAVAGGLAGIYYGADNIPQEWLAEILKRDVIERLCAELECLPQKTGWVNDSLN